LFGLVGIIALSNWAYGRLGRFVVVILIV